MKPALLLLTCLAMSGAVTAQRFFKPKQIPDNYDLTGTWVGSVWDNNSTWYYQISLARWGTSETYFGLDSFRLEKKSDIAILKSVPIGFTVRQTFTTTLNYGINNLKASLNEYDVKNVDNPNIPLVQDIFMLQYDHDELVMVSGNNDQSKKILLRRQTTALAPTQTFIINSWLAAKKAQVVTDSSLEVENVAYAGSNNDGVLRYNDQGHLSVTLKNHATSDIGAIQINTAIAEPVTGLMNFNGFNGTVSLGAKGEVSFAYPIATNFGVPGDSLHFTMTFGYNGFTVKKQFAVPTAAFFHTSAVSVPVYTSPRMQAISGFYGFQDAPYTDVVKPLDALAAGGDKLAAMWKAVFLSMGYGGYKIDEDLGHTLARSCIRSVEDKARNGDGEAQYLMFYACQMGLEGDNAVALASNFLEKSAKAGFKPAVYDYALELIEHKDYTRAFPLLVQSYRSGIKQAANMIGYMYEKGLTVPNEFDSAIAWYKKGMTWGNPDSYVWYAQLVSKGYNSTPPDMTKALALTQAAAAKNSTDAMIFEGEIYLDGKQGIAQNVGAALKWFRAGAELGDRQAMLALGEAYLTDAPGFVKDEKSGLFWIKRAAELGSPRAQVILAKYCSEGTVAEKDVIAARYWYNQAVQNGFAEQDATGINANAQNFMNFWKYADFSPSYVYVNEYNDEVGTSGDGLMNGIVSGLFGAMSAYYGSHQDLINGMEAMGKKDGCKVYGGTVSSGFVSTLMLKRGQTIHVKAYGVVSAGMFAGTISPDGFATGWEAYRIIKTIPCSAVMGTVKDGQWQFIGHDAFYTAPKDGPFMLAL